jgi:hypothetical protein
LSDIEFFGKKNEIVNDEEGTEITEKEYTDNHRYRCYRRCRYYKYRHRWYKRCYRRCYRVRLDDGTDLSKLSDEKFFSSTPKKETETAEKEEEITEKEYQENHRYRCYTRCRYFKYRHRWYKRCYRRCYRVRLDDGKTDI